MSSRPATRMNLLAARRDRALAAAGARVLNEKRDALLREVQQLAKELAEQWRGLDDAMHLAAQALVTADAIDGRGVVAGAGLGSAREIALEVETRRIWGVDIPEVRKQPLSRGLLDRGLAPAATSSRLDRAAGRFEAVLDLLLDTAPTQIKIRRLGTELRSTNRKINTLEQQVLVDLDNEIAAIEQQLDEREREERFRLKHVKRRQTVRRGEDGAG